MSSHPLPPPPAKGDVLCQPLCSHIEWVGREHGEGGTEVETRPRPRKGLSLEREGQHKAMEGGRGEPPWEEGKGEGGGGEGRH